MLMARRSSLRPTSEYTAAPVRHALSRPVTRHGWRSVSGGGGRLVHPLTSAGSTGKALQNLSGGDGSESAYQRIRNQRFQAGTVPEPLNLHGWQMVDEINRALASQPPSGYSTPVHLVTADNIASDGGPKNSFDPDNGYRDAYRKIWSK